MHKKAAKKTKTKPLTPLYDHRITAWIICIIAAVFYAYDFLLRVQPSVMIHPLMQFYGINASGIGVLSAFYYYAYTPMQIPAGLIIDKFSTRSVLTISAFLCALGAILFGLLHIYSIALIARALMGIGSAFAFIGALKLGALWLPQRHFALFTGFASGLGTIGALVTDTVLSGMVGKFGWQETVLITGYVGIVISLLIFLVVRNKPNRVKPVPHEFKNWHHAWGRLLFMAKEWQFWINGVVGSLLYLPVNVFAALWGIAYLQRAYLLSNQHAGVATSLIFIGTAIGSPIAGWVSDKIKRRKVPLYIGCLFTLLLSLAVLFETNISLITLYVILFFLGFFGSAQVLVFSIAREISPPRTTGTATAGTNCLVTAGAAIFQPLIGYFLVKFWSGGYTITGVPHYTVSDYRNALLVLPIALAITFVLIFLLPETNCKLRYHGLRRSYK